MSFVKVPSEWAAELCRILGDDPSKVTRIQIATAPNSVVTATIERLVTPAEGKPLLELLKKVAWVDEKELTNAIAE